MIDGDLGVVAFGEKAESYASVVVIIAVRKDDDATGESEFFDGNRGLVGVGGYKEMRHLVSVWIGAGQAFADLGAGTDVGL